MVSLKDVRHEFADAFVPQIKLHVAVSTTLAVSLSRERTHETVALACVGLSKAGVLLSVEDGRAAALAILCACAQKDEELGRPANLDADAAIDLLRKVAS